MGRSFIFALLLKLGASFGKRQRVEILFSVLSIHQQLFLGQLLCDAVRYQGGNIQVRDQSDVTCHLPTSS